MELTPEQFSESIKTAVTTAMDAYKAQQIDRKFTPGLATQEINRPKNGGFKTFGEFLRTIKFSPEDARLKLGFNERNDGAGGFTVPEEYLNKLLGDALEQSVVRAAGATVIPMTSDTLNIPKIVDSTHSAAASVFGGVIAYWLEESGEKTATQAAFGNVKLIAKKLTGYTYASDELLADNAIGLEGLIGRMFSQALAWYEDYAFLRGSGVGQPLGILNSGALLTINRSAASTIALADLANMWARLLPGSHDRAVWLANQGTFPQLAALATTNLTWLDQNQGLAKAPPSRIFGRPLYITEKLPALGTAGDIVLADMSYYLIGERQSIQIATSPHVRFTTDETAWRFVERVDGQPWVDAAFTPAAGSTLSPFVCLYTATTGGS